MGHLDFLDQLASPGWWILGIVTAVAGYIVIAALKRLIVRPSISLFRKSALSKKRMHILYLSELTVNSALLHHISAEASAKRFEGFLFTVVAIFFVPVSFLVVNELDFDPGVSDAELSVYYHLVGAMLLILFIASFSIYAVSESHRKNLYRASILSAYRNEINSSFLQELDADEAVAVKLMGDDLRSASDDQINLVYLLLGCNIRSRFSNFLRFRVKNWF